jgi:general secretion pathway protein G
MKNSFLHKGFTLTGLLIALSISIVIGVLSIPTYQAFVEEGNVARAIAELGRISLEVEKYRLRNGGEIPADFSVIGLNQPTDPWGHPFEYRPLAGLGASSAIKAADRIPLNSDYDLFSVGPDGDSGGDLFAPESRDNIVRALDGGFFGIVTDLITVELAQLR